MHKSFELLVGRESFLTQTLTQARNGADGDSGEERFGMHPHTGRKGPESRGEGHLDFSTNLRDQEAAGSSPATPTKSS